MSNRGLNKKLDKLDREELVEAVKIRQEGDHFRATSGRGWHVVHQVQLGVCACTCKDFEYQHGSVTERCCKHLWAMFKKGLIGLTNTQIATWTAREYARERRPATSVSSGPRVFIGELQSEHQ